MLPVPAPLTPESVVAEYAHSDAGSTSASLLDSVTGKRSASASLDGDSVLGDELDPSRPQAKRQKKPSTKGASATTALSNPQNAKSLAEKEQRKEARMIRNRNAAQASRDRKKEHTQHLEARVAELEAQLEFAQAGGAALYAAATQHPAVAVAPVPPPAPLAVAPPTSRTERATASSRPADMRADLINLEDENDTLRTQLHLEQLETARLRGRLESLEDRFIRLEQLMRNDPSSTRGFPAAETTALVASSLPTASSSSSSDDGSSGLATPSLSHSDLSPFATFPVAPESPLNLDADVWTEWAHGLSVLTGGNTEGVKVEEDESDPTMDFLDLDYLHDAPVAVLC
ncbi:bZIP transcription factor [Pseudohyphozyma bogoriensis]|nr:bZIP transcription factor [Pseudohyphozyma bogoriensis]